MKLMNISHLELKIAFVMWVVAIMAFNPLWMLIPYVLISILFFIRLLQIRNENKLKHSRDIFKDFQYPEVTFNSYLKDGLKLEVKPYPNEINEHLEDDAYKDERETTERRNVYIKLHNEELNVFYSDLQEDIINYIEKQNFIKYDASRSSAGQMNYFYKDIIKLDILRVICNNYQTPEFLMFWIQPCANFHNLYLKNTNNVWIASGNKKELEEIEKEIIKKFNDAIKKFKFMDCALKVDNKLSYGSL